MGRNLRSELNKILSDVSVRLRQRLRQRLRPPRHYRYRCGSNADTRVFAGKSGLTCTSLDTVSPEEYLYRLKRFSPIRGYSPGRVASPAPPWTLCPLKSTS